MEDPEAAHIFPFSATEERNFYNLNRMLRVFWGMEQAQKWAKLFESIDTTESARNLICLNHQLHWWFAAAKIAPKPLRIMEEGAVVVQFHRLKRKNLKPLSPLTKPFERLEFADILAKAEVSGNQAWGDRVAHQASGRLLRTGQTFVIGTKYYERTPRFQLLQFSWDLHRVAAISGAALPGSLDAEDSDGGDYFGVSDPGG